MIRNPDPGLLINTIDRQLKLTKKARKKLLEYSSTISLYMVSGQKRYIEYLGRRIYPGIIITLDPESTNDVLELILEKSDVRILGHLYVNKPVFQPRLENTIIEELPVNGFNIKVLEAQLRQRLSDIVVKIIEYRGAPYTVLVSGLDEGLKTAGGNPQKRGRIYMLFSAVKPLLEIFGSYMVIYNPHSRVNTSLLHIASNILSRSEVIK